MIKLLSSCAILFYLIGGALQWRDIKKSRPIYLTLVLLSAIALHGYLLYQLIDIESGQNLAFFNLLSLVTWVCATLIVITRFYPPIAHLGLILYPAAACSILLATNFPANHVIDTSTAPYELIHILLSVLTFSVFTGAAIQAVTLAIQEKYLRDTHKMVFLQKLPPLETMEDLLFKFISLGVVLLSIMTITSFVCFYDLLLNQFLQKTILTLLALLVFIILLIGRYYYGWRGKKAISYTLSGVFLVALTYFGSLFITGFLS